MKTIINTVILLFSLAIFAQSSTSSLLTSVEWTNNNLDYINFSKDSLTYNLAGKKHSLLYDLDKMTLSLKEKFMIGGTVEKEEKITFKIKYLNKNKLVIAPIDDRTSLDQEGYSKLDYTPFFNRKEFVFYNRNEMMKRVDYKKITFHGSTCFGTCPSFSVEINRDGKIFYQGRIYTKEYTGNFEGQLSREERITLAKIINRSQIATIDKDWKQNSHVTDQPRYNYIIELKNGKKYEINTNDQHPILDKLSNYLVQIPEKLELKKVKKPYSYAKPSLKGFEIVYREED